MKAATALGAKTARACDSCLRRRARWFCAADDAFLCHGCDNLVHSANQLASRHERVRLQTASCSKKAISQVWYSGFTRKARTPRHNSKQLLAQKKSKHEEKGAIFNSSILPVVPELGSEEGGLDESDEQFLCRVPEFDPFEDDLCNIYSEVGDERLDVVMKKDDVNGGQDEATCDLDNFSEFLASDMDLAEFAADVESLLESGLDESGEELLDCKQEEMMEALDGTVVGSDKNSAMVKIKGEEVVEANMVVGITGETLNWNIQTIHGSSSSVEEEKKVETKAKILLRLNYEDVITAWASQGCPWTTGNPPQLNSNDCWPHCLGWNGGDVHQCCYGELGSLRGHIDGGREARVSRYREKRRTRLFSKKIRYEVRKLNAEKRPRMKGRFVKRASLVGTTALPAASR
ncbi:zinc finger protein CONSTANS-LIKE 16-like isoform X1 [Prosopis cineraria]|uniref:zinc finger protein CONSTANS-LIKE 16-like isoform X1 n=1 Tax=Prosopis cineraria TaxID=364024 RepID=UPI00240F0B66|nr:zinc finger protein CONSTANS-LIKE 16-like isoform X1 [Prosopis cineraria]